MQRWPQIQSHLDAFGLEHELVADPHVPLSDQLIERLTAAAEGEFGGIVGIGGDGTHSGLINALMQFRDDHDDRSLPPYSFIPMGTGNDIAKSFGLTTRQDFFVRDLRRAVSAIVHGADYHLDLGRLGTQYFVDAFTIGLDSEILRDRNIRKRRVERIPVLREVVRGNYLLYTWCMGLRIWRIGRRPPEVKIMIDGESWYAGPVLNVVVNNTRIYGGEFDFCPDAYANDGKLDVVVFTGPVDYLRKYVMSLRHNPQKIREMADQLKRVSSMAQGQEIVIECSTSVAAQIDGEELPGSDRFEISVVPNALHIKTPAEP
jgi:YegS/Rv2252/BmrU family lipid kinase